MFQSVGPRISPQRQAVTGWPNASPRGSSSPRTDHAHQARPAALSPAPAQVRSAVFRVHRRRAPLRDPVDPVADRGPFHRASLPFAASRPYRCARLQGTGHAHQQVYRLRFRHGSCIAEHHGHCRSLVQERRHLLSRRREIPGRQWRRRRRLRGPDAPARLPAGNRRHVSSTRWTSTC